MSSQSGDPPDKKSPKGNQDSWAWLEKRRTIRRFSDSPVPREHVEKIVRAAQRAPTACSFQTYSFIALTDPERRKALKELLVAAGSETLPEAPVWIIGCVDLNRYFRLLEAAGVELQEARQPSPTRVVFAIQDLGLALANLVTAAEALGYGSMVHACVMYQPEDVAEFLSLSEGVVAVEAVAIGVPAESPPLRPRWHLTDVLHWGQYRPTTLSEARSYLQEASAQLAREGYYEKYTDDPDHPQHVRNKTRRDKVADARDQRVREFLEANYLSF